VNIFVGRLAPAVSADDLRTAFASYGTVINSIVMRDTATNEPLGYGHVYLVPDEAARKAVAELDACTLHGQSVVVRECVFRTREERRKSKAPWRGIDRRQASERRVNGHQMQTVLRGSSAAR
jgi:RNA recognition motif-containing protein